MRLGDIAHSGEGNGMSTTTCRSPDAELIALCEQALRCEERITEIDTYGTSKEDCAEATSLWDDVFRQVAKTPATTPAGLRAKAMVLQVAIAREIEWGDGEPWDGEVPE